LYRKIDSASQKFVKDDFRNSFSSPPPLSLSLSRLRFFYTMPAKNYRNLNDKNDKNDMKILFALKSTAKKNKTNNFIYNGYAAKWPYFAAVLGKQLLNE